MSNEKTQSFKIRFSYSWINNFGDFHLNFIRTFIRLSVQTFQPQILIYRRCNFVYHQLEMYSVFVLPLYITGSFPLIIICKMNKWLKIPLFHINNNFNNLPPRTKFCIERVTPPTFHTRQGGTFLIIPRVIPWINRLLNVLNSCYFFYFTFKAFFAWPIHSFRQVGRGYWTTNYTGTQSFIIILSSSLD